MSEKVYAPSIDGRLKRIIAEQLGINEDRVKPDANFVGDLSADSLDLVELVMAVEDEFDIQIPDEAAETMVTFQTSLDYLTKRLAA